MEKRSSTLRDSRLWQLYWETVSDERYVWTEKVFAMAADCLKSARDLFRNFTLHDERHILNVLDAMSGVLGSQAEKLSPSELELLILSASLHDTGMTFTDDERRLAYSDQKLCAAFLRKNCPGLLGTPPGEWPDSFRQNYLRSLHPFRVGEVLERPEWRFVFASRPAGAVTKDMIVAVCEAHGQTQEELERSLRGKLAPQRELNPLFCALLLRLADLLDFDGSRAPDVLYRYALTSEKSREEWDKHRASEGFSYPEEPSTRPLYYRAECTNPNLEHAVRDFLDWADYELSVCHSLQDRCHEDWQRTFPFPWNIDRSGIHSNGYEGGDFLLTMEQGKILELLTGKNLYQDDGVFVRELLQNAVDATLLRSQMDETFSAESEEARIDLWEWPDKDGNLWFRIDDRGTGMTKGMLQRYFLKVGSSYYTSDELTRDLKNHRAESYRGISRFGIGFLSCFLCGKKAAVSTLYFDEKKNMREANASAQDDTTRYGLRLEVTDLFGYYTLLNQAAGHSTDALLKPENQKASILEDLEFRGYREKPGTSIVLCLNPGKLGVVSLREKAETWIAATRMPIYYNAERMGHTRRELMSRANRCTGENVISLTEEQKLKFDQKFPKMAGNYPEFVLHVISLDMPEYQLLDGLSGIILRSEVRFQRDPQWKQAGEAHSLKTTWIPLSGEPEKAIIELRVGQSWGDSWDIKLQSEVFQIIYMSKVFHCCYNGIACEKFFANENHEDIYHLFLLENRCRPAVDAGRTTISSLPLEALLAISAMAEYTMSTCDILSPRFSLKQWRAIRGTPLSKWIDLHFQSCADKYRHDITELRKDMDAQKRSEFPGNTRQILAQYFAVCFQDDYQLTVDYGGTGESVSLDAKPDEAYESGYDLFPPLLFCRAKNENSRRFLRAYYNKSPDYRFSGVINASHPYAVWLLENAEILDTFFQRQLQQIVNSLYSFNSPDYVIKTVNDVSDQLQYFKDRHGIDSFPKLSWKDFWRDEEDS